MIVMLLTLTLCTKMGINMKSALKICSLACILSFTSVNRKHSHKEEGLTNLPLFLQPSVTFADLFWGFSNPLEWISKNTEYSCVEVEKALPQIPTSQS